MDPSQLHAATLETLNQIAIKMSSPDWDLIIQVAAPAQKKQAMREKLRIERVRLALASAALREILDKLKANAEELISGQIAVRAALDKFKTAESVLAAVTSFVNVVIKVVPLV